MSENNHKQPSDLIVKHTVKNKPATLSTGLPSHWAQIISRYQEQIWATGLVDYESIMTFTKKEKQDNEINIEEIKERFKPLMDNLIRQKELTLQEFREIGLQTELREIYVLPTHESSQAFTSLIAAIDDIIFFGRAYEVTDETFMRLRELIKGELNTEDIEQARKITSAYQVEYRIRMFLDALILEASSILCKVIEREYDLQVR